MLRLYAVMTRGQCKVHAVHLQHAPDEIDNLFGVAEHGGVMEIDVLVIGSGAAGMLAAVTAAEHGQRTVLVSKGQIARSGATATIIGGCTVDGRTCVDLLGLKADREDTAEAVFRDTVVGGKYINDQRLVEVLVEQSGPVLKKLRDSGLRIEDPREGPGHASARGVMVSGMEIMQTLRKLMIKLGVKTCEEFFAVELLLNDGVIAGIAGIDQRSGGVTALRAKSVVIATGGAMMIYPLQTAPEELTGDGHAMALRAGADLVDMEMVQFLPCTLIKPRIWRGIQFPWVLGPQSGVRAWLLNRYGERFMAKWDPAKMELATRDVISIACMKEIAEGRGGPNGGVYLSWAHLPPEIVDFAGNWFFQREIRGDWQWEGFDFSELVDNIKKGRAVEVVPASHFFMGGIAIDRRCSTRVPGLFACGEAAGGLNGANRLSSNATAQIIVQGHEAGIASAAYAKAAARADIPRAAWQQACEDIEAPLRRTKGIPAFEVKEQLQSIANLKVGMLRSGNSLHDAVASVRQLRRDALPNIHCRAKDRVYNKEWASAVECRNMLETLEATALAALGRCESRGAHYRDDFPTQDNNIPLWNSIVSLKESEVAYSTRAAYTHRLKPPVIAVSKLVAQGQF